MKINVSAMGDPGSARTWSGTPYHICTELEKRNMMGLKINSKLGKYFKIAMFGISKLYYRSAELERGVFLRYARSRHLQKLLPHIEPSYTLHTSTLDLPLRQEKPNEKHFLLCDTTWHLWSTQSTRLQGTTPAMKQLAEQLEKKSYQQMAHIFSLSEYVKQDLIQHYHVPADKISVVGTGRGRLEAYYGEKDYTNHKILFAAKERFTDKGGHILLEAFRMAVKQNPKLELHVVGQESYKEIFAGIPNVHIYGFIPFEELQDLFNTSSVFVLPALNEPWGLVYLEALACKMPIVGLKRNSFPEFSQYGKFGFGLDDEKPESLAETLVKAFEDPAKLKQMGDEGQAWCLANFGWDKMVDRIVAGIEASI